jgi:hypothetical protein
VWTVHQAAKKYLKMVEPGNAALADLNDVISDNNSTVEQYNKVCDRASALDFTFLGELRRGKWPADVQESVTDLMKATAHSRTYLDRCASAENVVSARSALAQFVQDSYADEAALVRVALGLPANRPPTHTPKSD